MKNIDTKDLMWNIDETVTELSMICDLISITEELINNDIDFVADQKLNCGKWLKGRSQRNGTMFAMMSSTAYNAANRLERVYKILAELQAT